MQVIGKYSKDCSATAARATTGYEVGGGEREEKKRSRLSIVPRHKTRLESNINVKNGLTNVIKHKEPCSASISR